MGEESRSLFTNHELHTVLHDSTLATRFQTIQTVTAAGSASTRLYHPNQIQTCNPSAGLIVTVIHTEDVYQTIVAYPTASRSAKNAHDVRPSPPRSSLRSFTLSTSSTLPIPTQRQLCVVGLASPDNLAVCRETNGAGSVTKLAPSRTGLQAASIASGTNTSRHGSAMRQPTSSMATQFLVTIAAIDTSQIYPFSTPTSSLSPQLSPSSTATSQPTAASVSSITPESVTSSSSQPTSSGPDSSTTPLTDPRSVSTSAQSPQALTSSLLSSAFNAVGTQSSTSYMTSSNPSFTTSVASSTVVPSSSRASGTAAPQAPARDDTPASGLILGVAIGGAASLIVLLLLIVFLLRRRRHYRNVMEDAPRLPAVQIPGPLVVPLPASMDPQNDIYNRVAPQRYTMKTASGHDISTLTQFAITSYGIRLIPREEPPPNMAMAYGRLTTGGPQRFAQEVSPALIDIVSRSHGTAEASTSATTRHPTEGFQQPLVVGAMPQPQAVVADQIHPRAGSGRSPKTSQVHPPPTRSSPGQRSLLGLPSAARSRASSHTSFETGTQTASVYSLDTEGRRRRSDPFSWQNIR